MSRHLVLSFVFPLSFIMSGVAHAGACTVSASKKTVSCTAGLGDPMWVSSTSSTGFVVGIDLTGFTGMTVRGSVTSGSGWLLNLGDSETNNGYCGDSASTSNDSELWITGTNVYLCDSDRGGSDYLWSWTNGMSASGPFQILVSDGAVLFQNLSTGLYKAASSSTIFQVDGDEPDAEGGENDTLLWLGVNRVISGPGSRTGSGMGDLTVTFW